MRRILSFFLVIGLLANLFIGGNFQLVNAQTTQLNPEADAHVASGSNSNNNYGGESVVTVRGDQYRIVFIRFDLSSYSGDVYNAKLNLTGGTTLSSPGDIKAAFVTDDTWDEMTVTYNSKPSNGSEIASGTRVNSNDPLSLDITSQVQNELSGDGKISLMIYCDDGSTTNYQFNSKEAAADHPVLVISSSQTDEEAVALDKASLDLGDLSSVTQDISLPTSGANGTAISWTSDANDVISDDGIVTRPASTESNAYVVLTATITKGTASDTKSFIATVLKEAIILSPVADAHVADGSNKNKNFGSNADFTVRGDQYRIGFMKFDLSTIDKPIVSARINLSGGTSLPAAENIKAALVTDDSWNELTITYNNMPAYGADIAFGERNNTSDPLVLDITSEVQSEFSGDGIITVMIYCDDGSTTNYQFNSKEATSDIPELQIVTGNEPRKVVLEPEAVATVQGGSGSDQNFGGELRVRYDMYRLGFFRYDLSAIAGGVTDAEVRLIGPTTSINGAFVSDDTWQETSITYNTKPGHSGDIASAYMDEYGNIVLDGTMLDNVQQEIAGDKKLSLMIYSTTGENTTYTFGAAPKLVLDVDYVPVATSIEIEPLYYKNSDISIPQAGAMKSTYVAAVEDQYGMPIEDAQLVWSVESQPQGVSVDSQGVVSVASDASEGAITLRAESQADSSIYNTYVINLHDSIQNLNSHPFVLYDASDYKTIRDNIANNTEMTAEYNRLKDMANWYSLAELDQIEYLFPWSTMFTFTETAPTGAETMIVEVGLSGIGELSLDNIKTYDIGYGEATVANVSFENGTTSPDSWTTNTQSGNPIYQWDTTKAHDGDKSVSVSNISSSDKGGWSNTIAVEEGHEYSIVPAISILSEPEKGAYISVTFLDVNQEVIQNSQSGVYNYTTLTSRNAIGNPLQAAASVYVNEGDLTAAQKAKKMLIYSVENTRIDMDHYLKTGIDIRVNSQAVHVGRAMVAYATAYDMIKDSGVITQEEDNHIRANLYWIADVLMDQDYYDITNTLNRDHNYNTDRSSGLGVFAIAFPEYYKAQTYLTHAQGEIDYQLGNPSVVLNDGVWHETFRYQAALLDRLITFGKARKKMDGVDLFTNPKLKKMFQLMIEIQTPQDAVSTALPNSSTLPVIGDTGYNEAHMNILGFVASEYAVSDPVFSKELMHTWNRGGSILSGSRVSITPFLYVDQTLSEQAPDITSKHFEDSGYVVFRQNFDQASETYMVFPKTIDSGHQHLDQGSFSLFYQHTPLSLDAGVDGYLDGTAYWYESSDAHNMVMFKDGSGNYVDGPATSSVADFYTSSVLDYVQYDIPDNLSTEYDRHVAFVKDQKDVMIIWDRIQSTNDSRYSLYTLSNATDVNGNVATAHCYNNLDLEITLLGQSTPFIESTGLLATGYPQAYQERLMIEGAAGQDYLTLLYPKGSTEAGLTSSALSVNGTGVEAYRVLKDDGSWFVIIVNNGSTQNVDVTISGSSFIEDYRTGTIYSPTGDTYTVNISEKSIMLLEGID